MKRFVLFLIIFCLMIPVQVLADEPIVEETITETVSEQVEEIEENKILESLDKINQTLLAIEFTGIIYVMIHFVEKWRKVIMEIPRR